MIPNTKFSVHLLAGVFRNDHIYKLFAIETTQSWQIAQTENNHGRRFVDRLFKLDYPLNQNIKKTITSLDTQSKLNNSKTTQKPIKNHNST